ncbi:serine hydrolase domain-containing protein [Rhodocytophaga aerolata]|uniref:Serine hydrolase domain-containing protein n=1 Tax=Rhodocytophaga aerolata TaxID=455078 RepID=A0ABT8RAD5_9BACT|nr:serine hydrolase domain-containing protein [Rhodocytophaga aerolata]MDO1449056.1 serine hydrolase domain-containing protein [Rhodocytophaga aerolata]
MKTVNILFLLAGWFFFTGCKKEAFEGMILALPSPQPFNQNHSKANDLQAILDEFTAKGLPGAVVAIRDKEGVWEGTSGLAKIETGTRLRPGFVHAGGSITKIYTAAAIMKLQELNKLQLDKAITNYLPANVSTRITRADSITVRMLLNHTSGIRDYIDNTTFRMRWFNNLAQGWTAEEALSYAYDQPLLFRLGSGFSYSNNNYMLLSLIITQVTGQEEAAWMKEHIFDPLQLSRTYYKIQPGYLEGLSMPNYYLDRYGDGRLQNVTLPTKVEIYSELGDGGLVATAIDFVHFMDMLVNGQIISSASYNEMKKAYFNDYGLGIDIYKFQNKPQYGHSGAVFGGASLLLYFEEQETVVFIASNTDGALIGGKTLMLYHSMKNKIGDYIASHNKPR